MKSLGKQAIILLIFIAINAYVFWYLDLNIEIFSMANLKDTIREQFLKFKSQETLPALTFQNYEEENINLASFYGQPVIISSWSTVCSFCQEQLLNFSWAAEAFKGQANFIIVNRAEDQILIDQFIAELNLSEELVQLVDLDDEFYETIEGVAMPETIFVDKEGFITYQKRGPISLEEIKDRTRKMQN